ncbi:hypothetical protein IWX75_002427 [Arthrobacter sp. CAN_A6]|uniref:hypothetical protein n=1 Tax=Arthrobacter sp. CAN_A6 TaxID=2787721 RepID=UPI0018CA0269
MHPAGHRTPVNRPAGRSERYRPAAERLKALLGGGAVAAGPAAGGSAVVDSDGR